jgi:protein-S-isoprenylcysteine O-methyltransferase Ste14
MKKILLAAFSNILMIILPLLGNPILLLNPKIVFIIMGSIAMWLTQPPVSLKETREQKSSDRFSVVLILGMSVISVVVPVIDWAYFNLQHNQLDWITFLGFLMIIVGILFRSWSVRALGKYFTATVQIQEQHQLIVKGPYHIVRHPSYLGAFLAIIAGGVILHSLLGLIVAVIAMLIAYFVRIRIEERELSKQFGAAYLTYQKETKMFIPYVW